MKIAICDDHEIVADKLSKEVEIIKQAHGIEAECKVFYSAEKLLEEIEDFSVVFLDIEMPGTDGIEAGRKIKQVNPQCKIIMATARIDRVSEVFFFQAFRFLKKPFVSEEIEEALLSAIKQEVGGESIELFLGWKKYKIKQKDISIVCAFNGYSEYKVGEVVFRKDVSLSAAEKELDQRLFFRISRDIAVNLSKVVRKGDSELELDGKRYPISKRRCAEFKKAYIEYDIKYR